MFNYDEDALKDMLGLVTNNIGNMTNMEDGYLDKMSSMSKSGLYGNGIEMIDSQIVSIKDSLTDFKSITSSNARAVEELEKRLKEEVENIELPKDFDASDVGINVVTDGIILSKNDGLSVDPSVLGGTSSLEDKYDTKLNTIYDLGKEDVETSELEDYEKTKEEDLTNIDEGVVNESELEELKEGEEQSLYELNDVPVEESSLENYKVTQKEELQEMDDNGELEEIDIEEISGDNDGYKG